MGLQVVAQQQTNQSLPQQELTVAFEQFNQLSRQLSQSYQLLDQRVEQLSRELKQTENEKAAALREKDCLAERLHDLIDFLPGGVVVVNPEGFIAQCNPAAITLLGEPLLGQTWLSVIKRCFLPRGDDGHEVSTVDGRRLGIATGAMKSQGQIILLTDLTQTRALQDQLNRQERLASMGKMVSALAHQIRTPLSSAMLYASHLQATELAAVKRGKFADKLLQRLQHLDRQVRDMLLFVKGDLAVNDQITIAQLQTGLAQAVEALPQHENLTCHWTVEGDQQQIRCNFDILIGALMNLVNNAIQAGGNEVVLHIAFHLQRQHYLTIDIIDNGPGMDADFLNQCAEAFVTTKSQGIGLGLNVVAIVARAHGGEFQLHADQNGGTKAEVFIPLVIDNKQ